MYRKIRITVASLVVVLACALSSAKTLSYFTDTDGMTSSFIVGNASVKLVIYGDVTGETMREFSADEYAPLTGGMDDIPFYLQATNTGNIPVYQRFRIVIPIGLEDVVSLKLPTDDSCVIAATTDYTCSNADYSITYKPYDDEVNTPAEYDIVSLRALSVTGDYSVTRQWPTEGIHISGISGVSKDLFTCAENDHNGCMLGINVYSDAIQTTGFLDAITAFENFTETHN